MKLADDQRKARAGLVDERKREAGTLGGIEARICATLCGSSVSSK
jgi:hypothetical protein